MIYSANQTVGSIAAASPASLRVFERTGIDYCCGGKQSLQQASETANIPVEKLLAMIADAEHGPSVPERQWNEAPARDLVAHIVRTHHAFVRTEIPRLEALLQKVTGKHGSAHKELTEIHETFSALAEELQQHLMKEERVLFPYIEQAEAAVEVDQAAPESCFGSVEFPISRMIADHDDAGGLLESIRTLSNNFALPEGACQSYAALYRGLEEFEQDLHRHIHLENNILFPRALELERLVVEVSHAAR